MFKEGQSKPLDSGIRVRGSRAEASGLGCMFCKEVRSQLRLTSPPRASFLRLELESNQNPKLFPEGQNDLCFYLRSQVRLAGRGPCDGLTGSGSEMLPLSSLGTPWPLHVCVWGWPLGQGIGRIGVEGVKVRWPLRAQSRPHLLVRHPWAQGEGRIQRQRECLLPYLLPSALRRPACHDCLFSQGSLETIVEPVLPAHRGTEAWKAVSVGHTSGLI